MGDIYLIKELKKKISMKLHDEKSQNLA